MAEGLYHFCWDTYYGCVEGLLVATEDQIKNADGKSVYFGEILGKHSEVEKELNLYDFNLLTTDKHIVDFFKDSGIEVGINPLEIIADQEDSDEN